MFHKFIMNINVTGMQFLCDAARWQSLQKSSLHLQIQALTVTVSPHIGHAVFSIPAHLSGHVTYGARAVPTSCVPRLPPGGCFIQNQRRVRKKGLWHSPQGCRERPGRRPQRRLAASGRRRHSPPENTKMMKVKRWSISQKHNKDTSG